MDLFASPLGSGLRNDPASGLLTVSQLNRSVAAVLDRHCASVWVTGEVSNWSCAASGHWYFSLKDASASVRAVMFRGRNQSVGFVPRQGDKIEVRAQVGLYEARGEFQLTIEFMRRAGAGDLYARFLETKARLMAEGLFEAARKRPLPSAPSAVGVVTSRQAAALRDVLTTLGRRAPHIPVVVYPAAVQGTQAPTELVAALHRAAQRRECAVLLLVRGGGAMEDLWAFNDETLARAIAVMPMPVITGVGHETDFTIADWVADVRAPTPTAAAVAAVPDRHQLQAALLRSCEHLVRAGRRAAQQREQRLDIAIRCLRPPSVRWAEQRARLLHACERLARAADRCLHHYGQRIARVSQGVRAPELLGRAARLEAAQRAFTAALRRKYEVLGQRVSHTTAALELVSPRAVLERGYAIVTGPGGQIARDAADLAVGAGVSVALAQGSFAATVTAVTQSDRPGSTAAQTGGI